MKQKEVINKLVDCVDEDNVKRYFEEKEKLHQLLLHEEIYWKQRAKVFWLEEGDSNTRFFHASASTRKKQNCISSLKDDTGESTSNHEEMCSIIKTYFSNIFAGPSSANVSTTNFEAGLITEVQNRDLTAELSFDEFTLAIKQMHPDKASGPGRP